MPPLWHSSQAFDDDDDDDDDADDDDLLSCSLSMFLWIVLWFVLWLGGVFLLMYCGFKEPAPTERIVPFDPSLSATYDLDSSDIILDNPMHCNPTVLRECDLSDPLGCFECREQGTSCVHFESDGTFQDENLQEFVIPSNKPGKGYCLKVKGRGDRSCNVHTGRWVLAKIDKNSSGFGWLCLCKYPGLVTQSSLTGDCNVDVACGERGRLESMDVDPFVNGKCLCDEASGFIADRDGRRGPFCKVASFFELDFDPEFCGVANSLPLSRVPALKKLLKETRKNIPDPCKVLFDPESSSHGLLEKNFDLEFTDSHGCRDVTQCAMFAAVDSDLGNILVNNGTSAAIFGKPLIIHDWETFYLFATTQDPNYQEKLCCRRENNTLVQAITVVQDQYEKFIGDITTELMFVPGYSRQGICSTTASNFSSHKLCAFICETWDFEQNVTIPEWYEYSMPFCNAENFRGLRVNEHSRILDPSTLQFSIKPFVYVLRDEGNGKFRNIKLNNVEFEQAFIKKRTGKFHFEKDPRCASIMAQRAPHEDSNESNRENVKYGESSSGAY